MDIIDRRPNPHGKNLENRQRVLARARGAIAHAAREAVAQGTLREVGKGEAVTIPADTLHEPTFHTVFTGGARDFILPGNKEFVVGDRLKRPEGGGGGGGPARAPRRAAARTGSASCSPATSSSTCSSRTWSCPTW